MFPQSCSVKQKGSRCVNPPEFVITISEKTGDYMVGVTCGSHKQLISKKIYSLQKEGKIPNGVIKFEKLKSVGTDCIRMNPDDLIQL